MIALATSLTVAVGASLAVLAAALWLHWFTRPAQRQRRTNWQQFLHLAEANDLSAAEARALWRIACCADLADPLWVFVRPTLLDHLSPAMKVPQAVARRLRAQLFGD